MNKQLTEQEQRLFFEIFAMGVLVNQQTEYCVFMDFSGHVEDFNIRFAKSKEMYHEEVFQEEINLKFLEYYEKDNEDKCAWFKTMRDILKQVLEDHELPYEHLTQHIEQTITYSL